MPKLPRAGLKSSFHEVSQESLQSDQDLEFDEAGQGSEPDQYWNFSPISSDEESEDSDDGRP